MKWFIGIFLVVLLVLFVWIRRTEGFVTEPDSENWAGLRNLFHYQLSPLERPGMIPVADSSDFDEEEIQDAEYTPGFPTQLQNLFRRLYSTEDPLESEDAVCRALAHPRYIDGRDVGRQVGCGWWFVEDPTQPSVGAYGYGPQTTVQGKTEGPAYPARLPAGRWIWDKAAAERAEDIKRCRTIQTCRLVTDECGFCRSKGYGVPVTSVGALKYPNDDVGGCGEAPIQSGGFCPDVVIKPRAYRGDYNYDANGNVIQDAVYKELEEARETTIPDVCNTEDGLTRDCRLRLCIEVLQGVEGKGLHRIITAGKLLETDRVALFYLEKRGALTLPTSLWLPKTYMSLSDAQDLVRRLYTIGSSGPPSIQRSAALWFRNETPFNPCQFEDADVGPFPLECLQREFRKAGCQASGAMYPTSASAYEEQTYGSIRGTFKDLYDAMNRDVRNVHEQDETIRNCLGVTVQRQVDESTILEENPNTCKDRGIEYWFTTIPTLGQRLLHDRAIVQEQDLVAPTHVRDAGTWASSLNGKTGIRGYTARTYVELSGVPVLFTFRPPTGKENAYGLWINGAKREFGVGTGGKEYTVQLPTYTRTEIEVRYEGVTAEFGTPQWTFSPDVPRYLAQSRWKPAISIQASKWGFNDQNRFLAIVGDPKEREGLVAKVDDRWGYPLNGASLLTRPDLGIWFSAAKTITCMVRLTSVDAQTTLWRMDQGQGGASDTKLSLQLEDRQPVLVLAAPTYTFQLRSTTHVSVNQWVHLAVVFGTQLRDSQFYVNGVAVRQPPTGSGTLNVGNVVFTRLLMGAPGWNGHMGWFHIYTTQLTRSQVGRDMQYDNPRLSDMDEDIIAAQRN